MSDFLPAGYSVPESGGRYMKLKDGENRFRVLSSPVVGNEFWNQDNKPVRRRMGESINIADIRPDKDGSDGKVKHFWAMPVIDHADGNVKVLEITQKSIQKAVKELASDKDWGSPVGYDLVVTRAGNGLETEYGVIPKPAKALAAEYAEKWEAAKENGFDLEALFSGGDPFTAGTPLPAQDSQGEPDISGISF